MSKDFEHDPYNPLSAESLGIDLLRAEITADGGFKGLFEALRAQDGIAPGLIAKYDALLCIATPPETASENLSQEPGEGVGWVYDVHARIQEDLGLSPHDASAYLIALTLHKQAFPEEYSVGADY